MKFQRGLLMALVLISSSFFGYAQNNQTIVSVNSVVYEYLNVICAEQGKVPGISERPATKAMVLEVLERIEYESLSSTSQQLYRHVLDELASKPFYTEDSNLAVDVSALINLEWYIQADNEHVDWYKPDSERKPFLSFPFQTWFFDSFYGKLVMPIKKEPFLNEEVPKHDGNWTNVPVNMSAIDYQFPYVAYLAVGGNHWNLQLGRDVLSYGSGRTGNFLISDHIPYYSFIRARTYWDAFSFYYTAIDLEPWQTGAENLPASTSQKVQRVLLSHGFMFNFIPRLRLTIKESSLLTGFDPTYNYLNPLTVFHNWYLDSSNSILTIDVELNVLQGVNLYGVLTVDQLQTFFELERYNANTIPNAYGYLLGMEVTVPDRGGYWLGNVEWVYTNPWLYIHEESNASYIWTGQIESHVDGAYFKHLPLGYPAGPDSMNLFVNLSYTKPQYFKIDGGYIFKVKGSQNLVETVWEKSEEAAAKRTPTGTIEQSHTAWLDLVWYPGFIHYFKEIGTGIAYGNITNENNREGEDWEELQWTLFVSLAF